MITPQIWYLLFLTAETSDNIQSQLCRCSWSITLLFCKVKSLIWRMAAAIRASPIQKMSWNTKMKRGWAAYVKKLLSLIKNCNVYKNLTFIRASVFKQDICEAQMDSKVKEWRADDSPDLEIHYFVKVNLFLLWTLCVTLIKTLVSLVYITLP